MKGSAIKKTCFEDQKKYLQDFMRLVIKVHDENPDRDVQMIARNLYSDLSKIKNFTERLEIAIKLA